MISANMLTLSQAELAVLRTLCSIGQNKLMAYACSTTEDMIKCHMRNLIRKTKTGNRAVLAAWAVKNGLD